VSCRLEWTPTTSGGRCWSLDGRWRIERKHHAHTGLRYYLLIDEVAQVTHTMGSSMKHTKAEAEYWSREVGT
jgi:hypothetical protein